MKLEKKCDYDNDNSTINHHSSRNGVKRKVAIKNVNAFPWEPASQSKLILTDSENDRVRWVSALQELHKVLKKNQELSKMVSWGIQYFSVINYKTAVL